MELTLREAAVRLGKSERQVRYLIAQSRLPAKKKGKRWLIDDRHLPQAPQQAQVATRRRQRLERKVDQALASPTSDAGSGYSVQQLRAFQCAAPIYRRSVDHLGADHPVVDYLGEALMSLTVGCHRFARSDKSAAYHEARDLTARAVCLLLLSEDPDGVHIAQALERELMPAFSGLLRRSEGRLR